MKCLANAPARSAETAEAIVVHAELLCSGNADKTSADPLLANGSSEDRLLDLFHQHLSSQWALNWQ
jgi:hypothetical protein